MKEALHRFVDGLYLQAFRLVYAHDGHAVRVVFILLNIWWFTVDILPSMRSGTPSSLTEGYVNTTAFFGVGAVFVGFLLMLFREHPVIINTHYLFSLVLLITGTLGAFHDGQISKLGMFLALSAICMISYLNYNATQLTSFPAMKKKAALDIEKTERLINQATKE